MDTRYFIADFLLFANSEKMTASNNLINIILPLKYKLNYLPTAMLNPSLHQLMLDHLAVPADLQPKWYRPGSAIPAAEH
jgi:hypothetical protein